MQVGGIVIITHLFSGAYAGIYQVKEQSWDTDLRADIVTLSSVLDDAPAPLPKAIKSALDTFDAMHVIPPLAWAAPNTRRTLPMDASYEATLQRSVLNQMVEVVGKDADWVIYEALATRIIATVRQHIADDLYRQAGIRE